MDAFVAKHVNAIRGVLSCFDRVLFRGHVPLMSGYAMAEFLKLEQVATSSLTRSTSARCPNASRGGA